MIFFHVPKSPRTAACPSTAARQIRPAHLYNLMALLGCALLLATACKRSEPVQTPKLADTKQADADTPPTLEELDKIARNREAFGLPLPPDAASISRARAYVTASSGMKIPELEAFYKSRLVDYEFIFPDTQNAPGSRPRELHIIGLRAYMPKIIIRSIGGRNGRSMLDFRPPREPATTPPPSPERADDQTKPVVNQAARRREKGMPVLDRNQNGELIAPGARWGEPYTPPKGTPLDTIRNSENFGRPYGEWQMP